MSDEIERIKLQASLTSLANKCGAMMLRCLKNWWLDDKHPVGFIVIVATPIDGGVATSVTTNIQGGDARNAVIRSIVGKPVYEGTYTPPTERDDEN